MATEQVLGYTRLVVGPNSPRLGPLTQKQKVGLIASANEVLPKKVCK